MSEILHSEKFYEKGLKYKLEGKAVEEMPREQLIVCIGYLNAQLKKKRNNR